MNNFCDTMYIKKINEVLQVFYYSLKKGASNRKGLRIILNIIKRKKVREKLKSINSLLKDFFNFKQRDFSIYQKKKLLEILNYSYANCEYYKNLFDSINLNRKNLLNFDKIPLLNKSIIRKNFNKIISKNYKKELYYDMNTGGSIGEPLVFLGSYTAGIVDALHFEFFYKKLIDYKKEDKIFSFDGSFVPLFYRKKNIYWIRRGFKDIPFGRLSYSSLYLDKVTMPFYIKHFLKNKPSIIRGYPSFINDIAEYILENKIELDFEIKGVKLTAEEAYPWQISNIKKAFKTDVYLQYGLSETCGFGFTFDDSYEFIFSPIYGFIEILDSRGKHVKKGQIGEIVLTGFWNKAQPFIRYQTGDLAIYYGNKKGVVKLKKILGRTQDYIYKKNMEKIALTALVFGQHLHIFKNIKKWQIIQNFPGEVTIKIIKDKSFSQKDVKELRKKFSKVGEVNLNIEFVKEIPLTKRGKYKFLIQKII
jgi:phenylacetate-CoA ligase